MTHGITVQLPVSVAFGTDEEFDLRVQLESDLTRALASARAGECIDTSHLNLQFDGITDPSVALSLLKQVLAAAGQLSRAVIILETPSVTDPDDRDQQVLWPASRMGKVRAM